MPPSVNKSNAKHYNKSPAVTEYHEFQGREHWTCAEPGWEEVADYALDWAFRLRRHQTTRQPPRDPPRMWLPGTSQAAQSLWEI